ncbi:hypothetical protein GCM10012275_63660 [Longimycelium tulufanense]|uniref:Protein kinase domain-containing protein n=1 Tax=Longimycelium tulufanense TaxID=907463 RepID=A0A8J3CLB4_9PSEU|nr:AarF/UbiB family protein [Longimycelium tulufanense]GGM84268.1 hypothetical protein GCM10012275_63660 [Longimycelium tulufanense]
MLLEDLGPTFIKGGQLLSTRRDLLSPLWCDALKGLHDRVRPMSMSDAERALARAYPNGHPFTQFVWEPVASGSIACVYRALLPDGRTVAVKLRRPGIERVMAADLALLRVGTRFLQRVPRLRRVPMERMVVQVGNAVLRQLDFHQEARALGKLRSNLAPLPDLQLPQAISSACGEGALVMEYLKGLRTLEPDELSPPIRRRLVETVLRGVYRMLFVDGLVHCDMHPGNLYLAPNGKIALLDAGFVVHLPRQVRRLFSEFFLNMTLGRGDKCAEVILRSAEDVSGRDDVEAFRGAISDLVRSASGSRAESFRLAPFAASLFDLQREYGIAAAPEFVFPLMSLLVLEGMVNDLCPEVDFQAVAVPVLQSALNE